MTKKQKLELTWIGKENRPRLEPRILLEDPSACPHRQVGDNLLALKGLGSNSGFLFRRNSLAGG